MEKRDEEMKAKKIISITSLEEFEEYVINNLATSYQKSVFESLTNIPKGIININNVEQIKIAQKYIRHTDLVFNKAIMRYLFSITQKNNIACCIASDRYGKSLFIKKDKIYVHLISQERFVDYCKQQKWVKKQMIERTCSTKNLYVVLIEDDKLSNEYIDILNSKVVNQNKFITFQGYITKNFGIDLWEKLRKSFSRISETVNKYKSFELVNLSTSKSQKDYDYYCNRVNDDFKAYIEKLKDYPTLLSGLSSAEYLYDLYINKMAEKQEFDYSCVSIMYYKTLEDFINTFLWIPYREEILEKNVEEVLNTKLYLNDVKYYYNYQGFKDACELGPLSFLCVEIRSIPKFMLFMQEKFGLIEEEEFRLIESFGEKLKVKTKNRNNAAHGGKKVSYHSASEDKIAIYPTESPEEIRGLIKELLSILYTKKIKF